METPQKNTVRPSIRQAIATGGDKPADTPVAKDFLWYLKNVCGGQDKYEFAEHDEAYKFGWSLREKHGDKIKVEIAVTTVRVWAL